MANLSNINNKLIVTDGGNLLVNATANLATYGGITIDNFSDPSIAMKTTGTGGWLWTQYITSAGTNNFSMGVNQSSPYWCVKAGAGMDSPHLVVNSSGNVGIGTITPAGKFEIKSAASNYTTAPAITFTDDTGVADSRWILGNIATNYGNFVLAESDSATTVNYSPRITVVPGGNVGIGTSSTEGKLTISYTAAELPTSGTTSNSAIQVISSLNNQLNLGLNTVSGDYGAYIQASDNNLAVPYPLNLQPNGGNVGIGVTGPVTKLEVPGSLSNSSIKAGTLEMQSYSVNNAWLTDNLYFNGSVWKLRSAGYASQVYFGSGGDITFKRYPTGSAGGTVVGITSLQLQGNGDVYIPGNVGIGTSSPQTTLEVVGETLINSLGLKANRLNSGYDVAGDNADIWINYEGYLNNNLYYRNFNIGDGRNGTVATFNGSTKIAYFQGNVGIGTTAPQGKLDSVAPAADLTDFGRATGSALNIRIGNAIGYLGQINFCNDAAPAFGYGSIGMVMTSGSGVGLGDMVFGTKSSGSAVVSTERMRITSGGEIKAKPATSGRAFFSTQDPGNFSIAYTAYMVNASTKVLDILWYGSTIGSITVNSAGSGVDYNTTSSDERLKKNITNWDENILDKFKDIKPKEFNFNNQDDSEEKIKGYIAQNEVDKFPEAYPLVYNEEVKEDRHLFNPSGMVVYLMKAIQELKADNDSLKARIEILENK